MNDSNGAIFLEDIGDVLDAWEQTFNSVLGSLFP